MLLLSRGKIRTDIKSKEITKWHINSTFDLYISCSVKICTDNETQGCENGYLMKINTFINP